MKITARALRKLVNESIDSVDIIRERPWSVEHTFSVSPSDSGAADGLAIVMKGDSGKTARVLVDAYWNPQMGDESGNSIKFEVDGEVFDSSYVPAQFSDGEDHRLYISNSPVAGLITIAHAKGDELPVVYLVAQNPFGENEDVEFDSKNLGNGSVDVELSKWTSL
jgi:hypothetical protein